MFVTIDRDKEDIVIEEEARLQEKVRLKKEVEEGPNYSRDGCGKMHTEVVGLAEEADNRPFPTWG